MKQFSATVNGKNATHLVDKISGNNRLLYNFDGTDDDLLTEIIDMAKVCEKMRDNNSVSENCLYPYNNVYSDMDESKNKYEWAMEDFIECIHIYTTLWRKIHRHNEPSPDENKFNITYE